MVPIDKDIMEEIQTYQNMIYAGSQEASVRLFSIPKLERYQSVQTFPAHLPKKKQLIVFAEGNSGLRGCTKRKIKQN